MEKITAALLKHINACDNGIDFFVRNNLEGLPVQSINLVSGDFGNYVLWLKEKLPQIIEIKEENVPPYTHTPKPLKKNGREITRVYDDRGNVLKFTNTIIDEEGKVNIYEEEYDYQFINGILYKITDTLNNKVIITL